MYTIHFRAIEGEIRKGKKKDASGLVEGEWPRMMKTLPTNEFNFGTKMYITNLARASEHYTVLATALVVNTIHTLWVKTELRIR